jgi:uncharacterized protein YecE (DUF72 family)
MQNYYTRGMKRVFIGTSGYVYQDWKGIFYPEGLPQKNWLRYYSQHFRTVEINATFYGSFSREIFGKWRGQTGEDFRFTLKGTRYVTHVKRLKDKEASLERFFTTASGLGEKLSCVLWQFPKNFVCKEETMERFTSFLASLPPDIPQTIEFRHASWLVERIVTLLNKYRVGCVINDSPHFPHFEIVTGDFAYIRFHGPGQLYASKYSDDDMKQWAEKIKEYREKYDVYCYFNNDYFGYAIENAEMLATLL